MCIQELLKQEQHLKDSKKNSSAQIMELSAQLKSIYEEVNTESNPPPLPCLRESVCLCVLQLEETKRLRGLSLEQERRLTSELDKVRADHQQSVRLSEEDKQQLVGEINALRRELQDHRAKVCACICMQDKQQLQLLGRRSSIAVRIDIFMQTPIWFYLDEMDSR
jgi:hypothetical protein